MILSTRERQVLVGLADGKTTGELSQTLGISVNTVLKHRQNAREKFGVSTTVEAVACAFRTGEIQ